MNIGICGISGRMGKTILEVMVERGHTLKAAFDHPSSPYFGKDAGILLDGRNLEIKVEAIDEKKIKNLDGLIDFSSTEASLNLLQNAAKHNIPLVSGTTGFTEAENILIQKASEITAVMYSPNMSAGVNLLFKLAEIASKALDSTFDIEIFESHHNQKKDAPSGTAVRLGEILKKSRADLNSSEIITGRSGFTGERNKNEIGILAMRGGDIVGEHTVFFAGAGERIELTHRAGSRRTFASGAVMAVEFLKGKKNGNYSMFDVLGL